MKSIIQSAAVHGEVVPTRKAEKKAGKRIGYNYIIIKSLKESQKNDVVKCLYIKSLTNFGFCVIKEGTYGDTKDREGRDIRDRLIWQQKLHEALQNKVKVPRLLGSFEENGNYYLVIERIKGKPLYKAIREQHQDLRDGLITGTKTGLVYLDYLLQIMELMNNLHQQGIVHRDATANNFIITPDGKVAIIDMELSYSLHQQAPMPPFTLGTYGYMSPEQLKTAIPTVKEDIFSIGAVVLQVWTGISPFKLTDVPFAELSRKINFFIPDKRVADAVAACLHPEPSKRPVIDDLNILLTQYKDKLAKKQYLSETKSMLYDKQEITGMIQSALHTLSSPLLLDADKGWFSEGPQAEIDQEKNKLNKAWYTSFNRGGSGVLYLLSDAQSVGFDVLPSVPHVQYVLDLIQQKYIERIDQVSPSLHFGAAGVAAALARSIQGGLVEPQTHLFEWIKQLLHLDNEDLGYTHGIAGQGIAHWLCHDILHPETVKNNLQLYANKLINEQQKDGSWIYKLVEDKNQLKKRQGFGTGAAGIVYFLLEYAKIYNDNAAMQSAEHGLRWLMRKSVRRGNTISWRNSKNKNLMHWWSEGTSGIALAFIKAYTILGRPTYKQFATGALLNVPMEIVDNNLSQFEGLSGLGNIYIEAARVFGDVQWQERADWIAQVIMHMHRMHPAHGPYWLVQHERQPTSDFMIGNSGVIHFLLRYIYPNQVGIPMLP